MVHLDRLDYQSFRIFFDVALRLKPDECIEKVNAVHGVRPTTSETAYKECEGVIFHVRTSENEYEFWMPDDQVDYIDRHIDDARRYHNVKHEGDLDTTLICIFSESPRHKFELVSTKRFIKENNDE